MHIFAKCAGSIYPYGHYDSVVFLSIEMQLCTAAGYTAYSPQCSQSRQGNLVLWYVGNGIQVSAVNCWQRLIMEALREGMMRGWKEEELAMQAI